MQKQSQQIMEFDHIQEGKADLRKVWQGRGKPYGIEVQAENA